MRATARGSDRRWRGLGLVGVVALASGCFFELEPPLNGDTLPRPVVLATSQKDPWAMVVDATHVYWTNLSEGVPGEGSVVRVRKDGSQNSPEELGTSQDPRTVALDDTHIYWTTRINSEGRIVRRPKTGSTNSSIIVGLGYPVGIAVDSEFVYWTDAGRDGVYKRAKNDNKAPIVELATMQKDAWMLVLGGEFLYWTNRDGRAVMRARKDGSAPPEMLAEALYDVFGIAVDDTAVYFRDADQKGVGRVMKLTLATRALQQLATTTGEGARFLAIDETNLYWTNGSKTDGSIVTALKDGSGVTTIVSSLPGPRGIALDSSDLFWSNWGGATVMKIEKPRKGAGHRPAATSRAVP